MIRLKRFHWIELEDPLGEAKTQQKFCKVEEGAGTDLPSASWFTKAHPIFQLLITAGLAIFLPGNPSELLIGVAISAYCILYDLQAHTPIDDMGNNVLIRFVEH